MSARIIELAEFRTRRLQSGECAQAQQKTATNEARFSSWTGASGANYVHTVYSLIDCPPLPDGNFILVRRGANGHCDVLAIGRVSHRAHSLNLARLRQLGARLGADEVHVHLLADSPKLSKLIESDLNAARFDARSAC